MSSFKQSQHRTWRHWRQEVVVSIAKIKMIIEKTKTHSIFYKYMGSKPGPTNNKVMINENNKVKTGNIKQISPAAEKDFNIEMKHRAWSEAIEICLMCVSPHRYLSENMLKDIVEIIMNARDDHNSAYTIEYILQQCQHTLLLHFNMHPPCVSKDIRNCYKNFLTSPIDKKEKTLSNRIHYQSEDGIVSYCFNRLLYEISKESKDDTLLDIPDVPETIRDPIRQVYWMRENIELFEFLFRTERIERLMIVLECIIILLQTDLALWHSRCISNTSQMRSQKPLLDYILWPSGNIKNQIGGQCRTIIKLFAYFIHLKYPEQHIKTMSLWMNTVIERYYMYDRKSHENYPNIDNYFCSILAKEFLQIISPLPTISITKILEKVQPFMRHIIGLHQIKYILKTNENNIIDIFISCVNKSWKNIPHGGHESNIPDIDCSRNVEPKQLLDLLSEKCKKHLTLTIIENGQSDGTHTNPYEKLDLEKENNEMHNNHFINLLFITFLAYLDSYDILNFKQTLQDLNNSLDPTPSKGYEESSYKPYCIDNNFVQKYRSTMNSLEELGSILSEKYDETSKKLFNLINTLLHWMFFYCSLILYSSKI